MQKTDDLLGMKSDSNLYFNEIEYPVVLQVGGNDCQKLFEAVKRSVRFNYDEINLNCGCPSVQTGIIFFHNLRQKMFLKNSMTKYLIYNFPYMLFKAVPITGLH